MAGEVRITSGSLRGRTVRTPPGLGTRPLLTRVRKALADILRQRLPGARVLDLFAGSGAIAFELISNGGVSAVLCELDPEAAELIRRNAGGLGIADRIRVITGDALQLAPRLAGEGAVFDVIVVAPPYGLGLQAKALQGLRHLSLLAPGGVIVVQRDVHEEAGSDTGDLSLIRERAYGRTVFEFFERRA